MLPMAANGVGRPPSSSSLLLPLLLLPPPLLPALLLSPPLLLPPTHAGMPAQRAGRSGHAEAAVKQEGGGAGRKQARQ